MGMIVGMTALTKVTSSVNLHGHQISCDLNMLCKLLAFSFSFFFLFNVSLTHTLKFQVEVYVCATIMYIHIVLII